jgi:hypothetical protein
VATDVVANCDYTCWIAAVEFEWDEEKRQKILTERSLDFADASQFFDALFDGKFFTLVWMWRGAVIRVISMRRSHEQEERKYRATYSGGT